MTDEDNRRRPSLATSPSTSSSQGANSKASLPNRDSRRLSSADSAIMPRPPRTRPHRSDAGNPSEGSSSTAAPPGPSFPQPPALDGEEREERRHNRLGYQRTTVACSHCRRRKIRCEPSENEPSGRCVKCIKWDKECIFEAADQSTAVARPSRSKRGEPNSESPSTSATSTNLHDQGQFEPSPQDPEIHSASPHGYHTFGDAPPAWYQPFPASRLGYQHSYGPGVPYPNAGGIPAMDPASSYSTPDEQIRRYPLHYQPGQQPTAMLDPGGRESPGSSYVISPSDNRWDGPSQRPGMFPSFPNQSHMYPGLAPHEMSGHPHQPSAFSQAPPQEGGGSMPMWNSVPPHSMSGPGRSSFVNGTVPSWDMSLQYEPPYQGHPQHQYQH